MLPTSARPTSLRIALPQGRGLSRTTHQGRHRLIVAVLGAHIPAVLVLSLLLGEPALHAAGHASLLAVLLLASRVLRGPTLQAAAASLGLMTASALFIHMTGGLTEMHFHFFVSVVLLSLYEDWRPFLLALVYVVLHHGLVGVLDPEDVYSTGYAQGAPWTWALVHGAFVLAAATACLVVWHHTEAALSAEQSATARAIESEERFRRLALEDPLTGALNDRALREHLPAELARAEREGQRLAVAVVDVDRFKTINDHYGHDVGDEMLRKLVHAMREVLRPFDAVARTGGDEFVLVLPGCGAGETRRIIARIRLALGSLRADETAAGIGISVGVATYPRDGQDAAGLLRRADRALYQAKREGRNRTVLARAVPAAAPAGRDPHPRLPLQGVRAVVADGGRDGLAMLADVLAGAGALVIAAAAGADELAALVTEHEPDVAVVDARLPALTPRAAHELLEAAPGLCLVVCSAYDDRLRAEDLLRAGASGYVVKGLGPETVVGTVADALVAHHRTERPAVCAAPDRDAVGPLTAPVTVMIADDDDGLREALADLVSSDRTLTLVAAAADAAQAGALGIELRPQVAIVDVNMPAGGGVAATRELRMQSPETAIIAYSADADPRCIEEMLGAGAVGYILKDGSADELLRGIHRAAQGQATLSDEVQTHVLGKRRGELLRAQADMTARSIMLDRLRPLLAGTGLRPVFQPIVDLASGETIAFEGLTRFDTEPVRTAPEWFREAEALGVRRELELACAREIVAQIDRLPADCRVSVNLSPDAVVSGCFADVLEHVEGSRLILEITEDMPVDRYEALNERLAELRDRGVHVAIDDVGAGYASMRHILELAPEMLKLDLMLVRGIEHDPRRQALVRGIVTVAEGLGQTVLGEGVETEAEREALVALGVTLGQGYLFGRPAHAAAFHEVPSA